MKTLELEDKEAKRLWNILDQWREREGDLHQFTDNEEELFVRDVMERLGQKPHSIPYFVFITPEEQEHERKLFRVIQDDLKRLRGST